MFPGTGRPVHPLTGAQATQSVPTFCSLRPLFQNVLISEGQNTVPERSEQTPSTDPANPAWSTGG